MTTTYRKSLIVVAVLTLLLAVSGCSQKEATVETGKNVINVETAVVKTMDITRYSSYARPVKGSQEEAVLPKLSGRVTAVPVAVGQSVRKGQVIVSLDRTKLEATIRQAEAAVASAEAAVAAGEIQRQSALNNYERTRELHAAGAVSEQALEGAKLQYDLLNTGAAEAGLAQAQAGLNIALQSLADCDITSPLDGIVGRIDVAVGDTASPMNPVAVINNTADLEVEVKVSESDVSAVKAGTPVKVRIKAVSEEPLNGTIKSVASVADSVARTYPIKVVLPNNETQPIKSGMFAEVMLGTQQRTGVLGIPLAAVLPKSGENVVYVVNGESHAQAVIVQTGLNDGVYTEVIQGLKEGQQVVTKGNTLIDDSSLITFTDGGTTQ